MTIIMNPQKILTRRSYILISLVILFGSSFLTSAENYRYGVRPYSLSKERNRATNGTHKREVIAVMRQYFTYLCAPLKCVTKEMKLRIGGNCFRDEGDPVLREIIADCLPPSVYCPTQEKEEVLKCAMDRYYDILPETVLDSVVVKCVDELLTVRMVKCIDPWMKSTAQLSESQVYQHYMGGLLTSVGKMGTRVTSLNEYSGKLNTKSSPRPFSEVVKNRYPQNTLNRPPSHLSSSKTTVRPSHDDYYNSKRRRPQVRPPPAMSSRDHLTEVHNNKMTDAKRRGPLPPPSNQAQPDEIQAVRPRIYIPPNERASQFDVKKFPNV